MILSSDSDFHRTLKIRIVHPESRVLNSDPRSWIMSWLLDQASIWALLAGFSKSLGSNSARARHAPRAACMTQSMVLVQGFRIYLEHLEVR